MICDKEFQAVVLAGGKGSRMTELTANQAKCLLPIGNVPMVWYPLKLLERVGFQEAIVIVSDWLLNEGQFPLDKLNLKIKLDIVGVEDAEELGTADSLRYIHDKIHTDFIVISCDLITDIDLSDMLDLHRKHNASITALMLPIPRLTDDLVTPGPKSKQTPETDLIGIDNETGRLIFLASASDFEDTVNMSQRLLKKHVNFTVHSKLLDAHLYIISKWVLDFLVYNKNFSTLKGELLPYIVSKQLSKPSTQSTDDKNTSIVQVNLKEDIFRFAVENSLDKMITKMSSFNDHSTDLNDAYHGDIIRCYAHVVNGKFALRANTVQMYHAANAKISELWDTEKNREQSEYISGTATVKCTQMQESRIDDNTFVDEKTSLKESHIGPNCTIETKTRVQQSVLMANVTVKQRCVIQNCILCNGCVIEEGAELKDCLVGGQHVVPAGTQSSREVLTNADRLIEI